MRTALVAFLLAAVGCVAPPQSGGQRARDQLASPPPGWTMEGGHPSRSSRTQLSAPAQWELKASYQLTDSKGYAPQEHATPLVLEGVAYVGHSGKAFEAVRLSNGDNLWTWATQGRVYGTAAFSAGLLIFGDDQGLVYALTLGGAEAWRFSVRYPMVSSPIAANGRVYLPVADQNVFCLDAATGRPIWQYGQGFPRRNALWRSLGLAYGEGRLYAGFSDGTVVALDGELGNVLWKVSLGPKTLLGDVAAGPSFADGSLYAGAFRGPTVCLDAATGAQVWRQKLEVATGFAVGEDLIYAGTPAGTIVALSRSDGEKIWEAPLDGGTPTAPVLTPSAVVIGASEGSLIGFDSLTGAVVGRYTPGPGVRGQALVFEKGALLLSNGGALHWIE